MRDTLSHRRLRTHADDGTAFSTVPGRKRTNSRRRARPTGPCNQPIILVDRPAIRHEARISPEGAISRPMEDRRLTYFSTGIQKTQVKRDHKATLLESVRSGRSEPSQGMTKDEAVTMLIQDIADYDEILARLRQHDGT